MSSNVVFLEEKPTTSNVDTEAIQWPATTPFSGWRSQQFLSPTTTTTQIVEPIACYVTAPELDSPYFNEIRAIAPRIEVTYKNRLAIEGLLGDKGKCILDRVISLAEDFSSKQDQPIVRIEISFVRDEEVKDWEYVLLRLIFYSDFESADNRLRDFYHGLNALADSMNEEDEHLFRRMFFFDVGTIV